MKMIFYKIHRDQPEIRPAPVERPWMDRTPQQFAYRCLPLNIANAHGWEVLCPASFTAEWDGGGGKENIRVHSTAPAHLLPVSHFGSGVLTFHLGGLVRTPPGVQLWVGGPVNRPKDAIQPLSGIVETDWAVVTFTMNWLFTRTFHRVRFEAGEPFCSFFPLRVDATEAVEPEIRELSSDPELTALYRQWESGRNEFNRDLLREGSVAREQGWQKTYFRGVDPEGRPAPVQHRTKVRLKPFRTVQTALSGRPSGET